MVTNNPLLDPLKYQTIGAKLNLFARGTINTYYSYKRERDF
jgi:hypothetical protein